LEDIPNLESLILDPEYASSVVVNHNQERLSLFAGSESGTVSSKLKRLAVGKVGKGTGIIARAKTDANLRALFSGIHDLDIVVDLSRPFEWDRVFYLSKITALKLRCDVSGSEGGA